MNALRLVQPPYADKKIREWNGGLQDDWMNEHWEIQRFNNPSLHYSTIPAALSLAIFPTAR
jgi:hypothetical protein